MDLRQSVFRVLGVLVMALLLLGAIYGGVNSFLFTSGTGANGIAVAAWAAFGSLCLVGAIFLMLSQSIAKMNEHLEHISDNSDEQVKYLKFIARQSQPRQ